MNTNTPRDGAQTGELILLWALVGIPLLWGVAQTFNNALDLFR